MIIRISLLATFILLGCDTSPKKKDRKSRNTPIVATQENLKKDEVSVKPTVRNIGRNPSRTPLQSVEIDHSKISANDTANRCPSLNQYLTLAFAGAHPEGKLTDWECSKIEASQYYDFSFTYSDEFEETNYSIAILDHVSESKTFVAVDSQTRRGNKMKLQAELIETIKNYLRDFEPSNGVCLGKSQNEVAVEIVEYINNNDLETKSKNGVDVWRLRLAPPNEDNLGSILSYEDAPFDIRDILELDGVSVLDSEKYVFEYFVKDTGVWIMQYFNRDGKGPLFGFAEVEQDFMDIVCQ